MASGSQQRHALHRGRADAKSRHRSVESDRNDEDDPDALRERIEELESDLDDRSERLAALEAEVEELDAEASALREYPQEVHERFREIGTAARESVVLIDTMNGSTEGQATDFWLSSGWACGDDLVATAVNTSPNQITVEELDPPWIETYDGERHAGTTLTAGESPDPRVALIEAPTDGLDPLSIGTADDLDEGDPILCVGHPTMTGRWLLSVGTYLRDGDDPATFVTDLPVDHGITGGPVFDLDGDVVGIAGSEVDRVEDPKPGWATRSETPYEYYPSVFDQSVIRIDDAVAFLDSEGYPLGGEQA